MPASVSGVKPAAHTPKTGEVCKVIDPKNGKTRVGRVSEGAAPGGRLFWFRGAGQDGVRLHLSTTDVVEWYDVNRPPVRHTTMVALAMEAAEVRARALVRSPIYPVILSSRRVRAVVGLSVPSRIGSHWRTATVRTASLY